MIVLCAGCAVVPAASPEPADTQLPGAVRLAATPDTLASRWGRTAHCKHAVHRVTNTCNILCQHMQRPADVAVNTANSCQKVLSGFGRALRGHMRTHTRKHLSCIPVRERPCSLSCVLLLLCAPQASTLTQGRCSAQHMQIRSMSCSC